MSTTGEEIFWKNARRVLRDIAMTWLDPAHGAAVDAVRWCLLVRSRPTHHRQAFLEREAPELLAYLERLHANGEAQGWRTLEERVGFHVQVLQECDVQPCARPWLAAIWHTLPELSSLGRSILDREAEKQHPAPEVAPWVYNTATGDGDDGDKGSGGKAGSTTSSKPRPSPRLTFPFVPVAVTEAEKKVLDLDDDAEDTTTKTNVAPDDPEGTSGPTGPKGPGGKR